MKLLDRFIITVEMQMKLQDVRQTVALPSPLPQVSASTANPNVAHTLCHRDVMECVKFSRDGKYLAAGCRDGKAYIYNGEVGTLNRWVLRNRDATSGSFNLSVSCSILRNLLAEEEDHITSVCFSRDGKYLATGSWDGVLFVCISLLSIVLIC